MIRYLTRAEVLLIHHAALEANGGMQGIRDSAGLDSALAQPQMSFSGQELYPTTIEKAAALGYSLMSNHPFVDGNKRVGWTVMRVFLKVNGLVFQFAEQDGVQLALQVAAGKLSRHALVQWLIDHVH